MSGLLRLILSLVKQEPVFVIKFPSVGISVQLERGETLKSTSLDRILKINTEDNLKKTLYFPRKDEIKQKPQTKVYLKLKTHQKMTTKNNIK